MTEHDFEHQKDLSPTQPSAIKLERGKGLVPGAVSSTRGRPAAGRRQLAVEDYVKGVLAGDRAILGRAITLIESNSEHHAAIAQAVLKELMPQTGGAYRIGITGVPGVGKSTFIEAFGKYLTDRDYRVAVLAVDPSSGVTGGSILGDKTRMAKLSVDENAFIRPSPAAGTLGGVARKTRETMLICEAAGFDVILVETVGVGQSETVVAEMTDFFMALMLAGAGDELQGIKRGLLELVDLVAVNKADGDNEMKAKRAAREYASAMHYMKPVHADWRTPVLTCSALTGAGIEAIWEKIKSHREQLTASGEFAEIRREQNLRWMWSMIDERLKAALRHTPDVAARIGPLEESIRHGQLPPTSGADEILTAFFASIAEAESEAELKKRSKKIEKSE